jgi:hypothetical protein
MSDAVRIVLAIASYAGLMYVIGRIGTRVERWMAESEARQIGRYRK